MALFPHPGDRATQQAAETFRDASPWIERLARMGYAAKGIVYVIIGGLAAQVAIGTGGRTTDTEGALVTILRQPFGRALLAVVAVGLVGYALWRFVQAGLDPEHKGTDAKGMVARAAYVVSGVIYGALASEAARMFLGSAGGSDGNEASDRTAALLSQPFGRWLVAAVGAVVVGAGLYQLYRAYSVDIRKRLDLSELDSGARAWLIRLGRFGFAARGVVFGLIGCFLILAALRYDPGEARGLSGALRTLQEQPYGPWLLGTVAFGLVAYGIFQLAEARYRRIRPA